MSHNLAGKQIGLWTVLERVKGAKGGGWLCRCECGTEKVKRTDHLTGTSGHLNKSYSCGCKANEVRARTNLMSGFIPGKIMQNRWREVRESNVIQRAKERCAKGDIDHEYVMLLATEVDRLRKQIEKMNQESIHHGFKDIESNESPSVSGGR